MMQIISSFAVNGNKPECEISIQEETCGVAQLQPHGMLSFIWCFDLRLGT